jgi:hypothetical protein
MLGYIQFLADSSDTNTGITPFFCEVRGDMPWPWLDKKLPHDCHDQFRENLDWSLTILARVEKKCCVPKIL